MRWIAILAKQARRIVLTAILGGLLAATMIRLSPGFGAGEEDLSADLSDQSRAALRAQRLRDANIARFYTHYLGGILRGDFGFSQALNRPVSALLKERLPETLNSVLWGMSTGLVLGFGLAVLSVSLKSRAADIAAGAGSAVLLSIPAAALALIFLWTGFNGKWAIALLVFPHI